MNSPLSHRNFLESGNMAPGGPYRNTSIEHIALVDLLEEHVPRRPDGSMKVVDLMLIDIEGGEFALINAFNDGRLDAYTICQIHVEFHNPVKAGLSYVQALEQIAKFVVDKGFIPMSVETWRKDVFHRVFFVNTQSSECIAKFLCWMRKKQ